MIRSFLTLVLVSIFIGPLDAQQLLPSGTPLDEGNYTWDRRTSTANNSSGQLPYYRAVAIDVQTAGNYSIQMDPTGFRGSINVYQGSFDPTLPESNFWEPGKLGSSSGAPLSFATYLTTGRFIIVLGATNTDETGTFSASISGAASISIFEDTNTQITQNPFSYAIAPNDFVDLEVYAKGNEPHTWQWYEGLSGDISQPITGADAHRFSTPRIEAGSRNFWVRVTDAVGDAFDSATGTVSVSENPLATDSGDLAAGDLTWNVLYAISGTPQHESYYHPISIEIQESGNYGFNVEAEGFNPVVNIYQGSFNSASPETNYYDNAVVGADGSAAYSGHFIRGTYIFLISSDSSLATGTFTTSLIGDEVAIINPPPPLGFTQQPLDITLSPDDSSSLNVGVQGETPIAYQWYRGQRGDTSAPVEGGTGSTLAIPAKDATELYWVRITNPSTSVDSRAATVYRATSIGYSDELDAYSKTWEPAGSVGSYKVLPFTAAVNGSYTFSVTATGFSPTLTLYQGVFMPGEPGVNDYATASAAGGNSVNLTTSLLGGPGTYYLVISSTAAESGAFTVEQTSGPQFVTPLIPSILEPIADQASYSGDSSNLFSVDATGATRYQWFARSLETPTAAFQPIAGATGDRFTSATDVSSLELFVQIENSHGAYIESNIAQLFVVDVVRNFSTDEDSTLLFSQTKLVPDGTLAEIVTAPEHGELIYYAGSRTFIYTPAPDFSGSDYFAYSADRDGFRDPVGAQIEVLEVNDPPVATPAFSEVVATPGSATVPLFGATSLHPVEDGQNLVGTFEWLPPAEFGRIEDASGTPVEVGDYFDALNPPGFVFRPSSNLLVSGQASIRLSVVDDGTSRGVADPQSAQFEIPIKRPAPSARYGNLLRNPCFEDGLTHWNASRASTRAAFTPSAPCGSEYALLNDGDTGSILSQTVNVTPGIPYSVQARWAGIPTPAGGGEMRLRMEVRSGGVVPLSVTDSVIQTAAFQVSGWRSLASLVVPTDTSLQIRFLENSVNNGVFNNQTFSTSPGIDGVSLTALDNFEAWAERSLPSEVLDPSLDYDGDGLSNRLEYERLSDPTDADSPGPSGGVQIVQPATKDEGVYIKLRVPAVSRADHSFRLEGSTDMESWQTVLSIPNNSTTVNSSLPYFRIPINEETDELRIPLDLLEPEAYFFRIP